MLEDLLDYIREPDPSLALARAHFTWAVLAQAVPTVVGLQALLCARITPWEEPREL